MYTRRTYLATLGIGTSVLAGCTSSAEDESTMETTKPTETTEETEPTSTTEAATTTRRPPSLEIDAIHVSNKRPKSHLFHALVLEGERPVFWRSYRAEPAEWEDGSIARATGTVWEDLSLESNDFSVYARVDERQEWESWTPSEDLDSCMYIELELETNNDLNLEGAFSC